MQKKTSKKFLPKESSKSIFRKPRTEGDDERVIPSGKKFLPSKNRDGNDFEGERFPKKRNEGGYGRGNNQRRENSRDDWQKPKPLYSTGGKKRFSRDEEPRPFRAKKDFNPKFSGRKNDEGEYRGSNEGKGNDDFKDQREFKKPKPFLRSEKQDGFSQKDDVKPFREKKEFLSKPPRRSNDDVNPFREKKEFLSKSPRRSNDEGKHRERREEPRPFLRKKAFNPDAPRSRENARENPKYRASKALEGFSGRNDSKTFREKSSYDSKYAGKKSFQKSRGKRTEKPESKSILDEPCRLNKYLAHAGIASRREADELIKSGFVTVNEQVVLEMGHKVQPGDVVKFKKRILSPEKKVYILLNKPKDYITTVTDDRGRPTVMELIQNATDMRIYPVGRLDRNTTGLLLLTNDGELAQKLTHPSFEAKKVYLVSLDKQLTREDMKLIADGVQLEEGVAMVDAVEYADPRDKSKIGIELHIGWNKVVRRIFETLGYEVVQLDRVFYAGLTKDVPRGKWRMLTEKEVIMLKHFA
ncbi:MAG: pseudouridine synthase [Chitinophagales bacterium]|nr:pseudouridine synthase [Chitinophagales bacterium]